jgi:hypothetical protein
MRMRWCVLLLVSLSGCVSQKAFDSKSAEARNLKQLPQAEAEPGLEERSARRDFLGRAAAPSTPNRAPVLPIRYTLAVGLEGWVKVPDFIGAVGIELSRTLFASNYLP